MKHLGFIIFCLLFIACQYTPNKLETIDFGSDTFDEPLVGVLDQLPILRQSLHHAPCKWLMSDTLFFEKTLELSFNEECIRSRSKLTLHLADSMRNPIQGVLLYVNDQYCANQSFVVRADSAQAEIRLRLKVLPKVGAKQIKGTIWAEGHEVDLINDTVLSHASNEIGQWQCEQKIGYPILIWTIWMGLLLLCMGLIGYLIVRLFFFVTFLLHRSHAMERHSQKFSAVADDDQQKTKEKKPCKCFRVPSLKGRVYWISEEHPQEPYARKEFEIHHHNVWGIFPVFEGDKVRIDDKFMSSSFWKLPGSKYTKQMKEASKVLYQKICADPSLRAKYTEKQILQMQKGKSKITDYVWHHTEEWLVMQLVKEEEHKRWKHTGGSYVWNVKKFEKKYGKEWFDNAIS